MGDLINIPVDCCNPNWWCRDGEVFSAPSGEVPQAAEGPFRTEDEAYSNCGESIRISCGTNLQVTCPPFVEFNWTDFGIYTFFFPYDGGGVGEAAIWPEVGDDAATAVVPLVASGENSATYSRVFSHFATGYAVTYLLHVVCGPDGVTCYIYYGFTTGGLGVAGVFDPAVSPWTTLNPPTASFLYGASKLITTSDDLINGAEEIGPIYMYTLPGGPLSATPYGTLTLTTP